jgi:hypothetical protein
MADEEQQELEQLEQGVRDTENELLKGAFEPTPEGKTPPETVEKAPPAEAAPPAEPPTGERRRDPATGQFVKRAAEEPAPAGTPAPAAEGQKPDEEVLPSWRAREINEERRAAQAEAERLRVENARLAAWVAQQQRAAAPKVEPQLPDPVLDPAGYTKAVQEGLRAEFAQKQMSDRLEMNLELTHAVHGEVFEKAFEAVCAQGQAGNNALVRHLVSQPNPGRAIIAWYNDALVRHEVGGNIDAYRQKTREQLLNDPKFLAEAAERARLVASGQAPNGQPRAPNTVVRLPPSLSRATGAADVPDTATDGSEEALFANAFAQPRRR